MSAWQSLGAGWKEGKLLRRLARCVIYLRSSDGAVCTCKKSGQHPDRGKLLVGLANVKQVCVQIVGQNGSRDGAAPNSQTSSDSCSSKPNVYTNSCLVAPLEVMLQVARLLSTQWSGGSSGKPFAVGKHLQRLGGPG